MTSENKPTPGAWFTNREGFSTVYVEARICGGWLQEVAACGPTEQGPEQQEANARLIAEAGTVHHECGLSPRELLERCQAMEAALNQIIEMNQQWADDQWGDRSKAESMACVKTARAALAKHKGG